MIDEIRPQKGRLVGLYSEGELVCSLDSGLAAEKVLKPGRYADSDLRELLSESMLRRAKSKALYLLNFRDYTRRDIAARLRSDKEYDEVSIEAALDYLTEIGAIDDARYAENMARHLINHKRYGRRRIVQELVAKGIDRDTAEEVLSQFDTDELSAIAELLENKFSRDLGDDKGIRRTIASLQRYGYDMSDIRHALEEYKESVEETEETEET